MGKFDHEHQIIGLDEGYPTLWKWMQEGKFPRARALGGKTVWIKLPPALPFESTKQSERANLIERTKIAERARDRKRTK